MTLKNGVGNPVNNAPLESNDLFVLPSSRPQVYRLGFEKKLQT